MKAIISDIHGNLEALQAVLKDADLHGAEKIYCLGDLVGYGPNPRECVDLAMPWKVVLLGNHDDWAVGRLGG
jgi:predicted phosphodiesterase